MANTRGTKLKDSFWKRLAAFLRCIPVYVPAEENPSDAAVVGKPGSAVRTVSSKAPSSRTGSVLFEQQSASHGSTLSKRLAGSSSYHQPLSGQSACPPSDVHSYSERRLSPRQPRPAALSREVTWHTNASSNGAGRKDEGDAPAEPWEGAEAGAGEDGMERAEDGTDGMQYVEDAGSLAVPSLLARRTPGSGKGAAADPRVSLAGRRRRGSSSSKVGDPAVGRVVAGDESDPQSDNDAAHPAHLRGPGQDGTAVPGSGGSVRLGTGNRRRSSCTLYGYGYDTGHGDVAAVIAAVRIPAGMAMDARRGSAPGLLCPGRGHRRYRPGGSQSFSTSGMPPHAGVSDFSPGDSGQLRAGAASWGSFTRAQIMYSSVAAAPGQAPGLEGVPGSQPAPHQLRRLSYCSTGSNKSGAGSPATGGAGAGGGGGMAVRESVNAALARIRIKNSLPRGQRPPAHVSYHGEMPGEGGSSPATVAYARDGSFSVSCSAASGTGAPRMAARHPSLAPTQPAPLAPHSSVWQIAPSGGSHVWQSGHHTAASLQSLRTHSHFVPGTRQALAAAAAAGAAATAAAGAAGPAADSRDCEQDAVLSPGGGQSEALSLVTSPQQVGGSGSGSHRSGAPSSVLTTGPGAGGDWEVAPRQGSMVLTPGSPRVDVAANRHALVVLSRTGSVTAGGVANGMLPLNLPLMSTAMLASRRMGSAAFRAGGGGGAGGGDVGGQQGGGGGHRSHGLLRVVDRTGSMTAAMGGSAVYAVLTSPR